MYNEMAGLKNEQNSFSTSTPPPEPAVTAPIGVPPCRPKEEEKPFGHWGIGVVPIITQDKKTTSL